MKCPTCRKAAKARAENEFAPFCSRRCRLADLDVWLKGGYAIAGEIVGVSQEHDEPEKPS